mgnify:CR=1 FL=1
MASGHDFKNFPELTNEQMDIYYFQSPHKQILNNFRATVVKVHDGDTISVRWHERDFAFPVRFLNIAAPELNESGGEDSQSWLEAQLLNEEVDILIDPDNRVEKWGRLLGKVLSRGMDMGELSTLAGKSVPWDKRAEAKLPEISGTLREGYAQWR